MPHCMAGRPASHVGLAITYGTAAMTPLDLYAKDRVLEAIYGLWKDEENTADRPVAALERITDSSGMSEKC
jgi:hypothetical protein